MNINQADKIFIIGLPRTGTTSICAALLNLGYCVAHTAYTHRCMNDAQVIADTPVFCDYKSLADQYPNAKFIYLARELSLWLPSIRQLLQRMHKNISREDGGFNPILKRCYQDVFSPFTLENFKQDEFLIQCYQRHQENIFDFFKNNSTNLLSIDISKKGAYSQMLRFLKKNGLEEKLLKTKGLIKADIKQFERINIGGKITAWNDIKHPNKIDSNLK